MPKQRPLKHIKNIKSSKAFSFSKRQALFRYPVGGGISYSSLPGLGKVAGPYAPSLGALVPLRLCRAGACLEDYYMICLLLRPLIKNPSSTFKKRHPAGFSHQMPFYHFISFFTSYFYLYTHTHSNIFN